MVGKITRKPLHALLHYTVIQQPAPQQQDENQLFSRSPQISVKHFALTLEIRMVSPVTHT